MRQYTANICSISLIALGFAILLLPACSGGGSGGSGSGSGSGSGNGNGNGNGKDFSAAMASYEKDLADKANVLADSLSAAYVEKLTAGESDPVPAVLDQYEGEVSEFNDFMCERLKALSGSAGPGDRKKEHMSDAGAVTEQIVRDAVIAALLNRALAAPPEQRDQILDLLGVTGVGPDGSPLKGTAALQDAGLMGTEGSVTIPDRGSSQYTQYLDWFGHEARGLSGPDVIKDIKNRIRDCTLEA